MKPLVQLGAILGISLMAAGATYWVKGAPTRKLVCDPKTLKADEVCLDAIPSNIPILWVDARHRADWEKTGKPGSILWNLDATEDMATFEAEAAAHLMEARRVIVYCGDENCGLSRQVAARIRELGLADQVQVLHGGWRALNEAGLTKTDR
ncbi:MAG: rhodanese-like domain-containing protein [Luteolibacter sp.]